jgi:hypothetical protein
MRHAWYGTKKRSRKASEVARTEKEMRKGGTYQMIYHSQKSEKILQ